MSQHLTNTILTGLYLSIILVSVVVINVSKTKNSLFLVNNCSAFENAKENPGHKSNNTHGNNHNNSSTIENATENPVHEVSNQSDSKNQSNNSAFEIATENPVNEVSKQSHNAHGNNNSNNTSSPQTKCPNSSKNADIWLKNIAIPWVTLVGLFGNGIAIVSISYRKMKSTFHQSLIALSMCDILFLIVVLFDNYLNIPKNLAIIYPYIWHPMRTILISMEAYLMMSIATERLLAVSKPIHYRTFIVFFSARVHMLGYILPPIMFSVLVNIPRYFETEFKNLNVTDSENKTHEALGIKLTSLRLDPEFIYYYTHWTRLIMVYLAVINILIFMVIRYQNKSRRVSNTNEEEMGSTVQISSAIALFSIVLFFILCNIPRLILNQAEWDIRSTLYESEICEVSQEIERLSFLTLVSKLCLVFNSSANVLIYYSVNRLFKMKIRMIMKYFSEHLSISEV